MTTVQEVYAEYAQALERGVDSLTDAEKRQAYLNACLAGQRVEPFATFADYGDAVMAYYAPGVKTLNQIIRKAFSKESDG